MISDNLFEPLEAPEIVELDLADFGGKEMTTQVSQDCKYWRDVDSYTVWQVLNGTGMTEKTLPKDGAIVKGKNGYFVRLAPR